MDRWIPMSLVCRDSKDLKKMQSQAIVYRVLSSSVSLSVYLNTTPLSDPAPLDMVQIC